MPRAIKEPLTKNASSSTSIIAASTTTKKRFGVQLTKNGILSGRPKTKKPKDINTVKKYLGNERRSNSQDEEAYSCCVEYVEWGDDELLMQIKHWRLLAKQPGCTDSAGYTVNWNFQ
ncbi:hypothetical protein MMC09_004407 [Bachmanniomyces sp. S44760]|nr:hypothetical protein [Bachmanniomyces sp. S44760]